MPSRDLSKLSDDELAAEVGRRKKKGRTYRVREYEIDEDTFKEHFATKAKASNGDDDSDDDDDDDDEGDDGDDEKPKDRKKGGFWD